ncbi:helix-turn-helix domain-containing protein [Galbibacter sp. EGI 63066]|uniref:winged helix-turn-helix transcriptional regulator n=1 Tax=Galbibacter sp. EGI 63066 TaxID=2993559 RepID=UPI002249018F|nr:helix-turn-helix domain-containing protein [Galbibacter sp. EGI 63066]MCX2679542.1 helix-turn-helix domain-containing protein [Galbibacter sp. EGI 63066]
MSSKQENKTSDCPFQEAMDLLSGKWTMIIINNLMAGKLRFKELERKIEGINTRMLVKTLKELESREIVLRKAYPTVPPTVEYSLTKKGMSLQPVIKEIQTWAINNMPLLNSSNNR